MASPAYEQILNVQALDVRLRQLRHQIESHPIRAELAEADGVVAAAAERVANVTERRHELERHRKRLSDEVAGIEAKRSEVEAKLYDGSVQASKELVAMQEESANLLDRQTTIEDDELELMEQIEEIDSELDTASSALAEATEVRDRLQSALDAAVGELDGEIAGVGAERSAAAEPADPTLLAHYEKLAPQFDGAPVARLVDGRCSGCRIQLSAVVVDQMAKAAEGAVITCEECGRLLVR